jgi:hypothetical protein
MKNVRLILWPSSRIVISYSPVHSRKPQPPFGRRKRSVHRAVATIIDSLKKEVHGYSESPAKATEFVEQKPTKEG